MVEYHRNKVNLMYEAIIEKIKERLSAQDLKVVIIPHISPDGDAVGSCSALWQVLDKVGIRAQLMTCDYIPDYLRWLKRIPDAISFQNRSKECRHWLREADVLFMLDHNTVSREGDLEPLVKEFKGDVIMIDHHPDPDNVTYRIQVYLRRVNCFIMSFPACGVKKSLTRI